MKIGKWVKLDWKKNDDGKDLRDVKRYKENNLTRIIYENGLSFQLTIELFSRQIEKLEKKVSTNKNLLTCIFI